MIALAACAERRPGRSGPLAPPPPTAPPGPVYVAVGASESVGVGSRDPRREAWTQVLHRIALPASAVLVNVAVPGATVADALREEVPRAVEMRPSLVTVWLNVNDIVAGVAPPEFEGRLEAAVATLRRGGATRVLVANVPPLDRLPAYLACRPGAPPGGPPCRVRLALPPAALNQVVEAYNRATAGVVERQQAFLVDLHAVGLAARRAGTEAELVAEDGFHPSTAGHAAVAAAFADVLRRTGPLPAPG